jgi:hypothetical protein
MLEPNLRPGRHIAANAACLKGATVLRAEATIPPRIQAFFACYHSKNATAMTSWPLHFWNDSTQKGLDSRWYPGHIGHERRAGGGLTRVPSPRCMHIIRRRINKNMSNCIKLLKRYKILPTTAVHEINRVARSLDCEKMAKKWLAARCSLQDRGFRQLFLTICPRGITFTKTPG